MYIIYIRFIVCQNIYLLYLFIILYYVYILQHNYFVWRERPITLQMWQTVKVFYNNEYTINFK